MKIFVLNGPELGRLGEREPEIYGTTTLAEVESMCREAAGAFGAEVEFRQTDDEATLVGWIAEAAKESDGIILNPAVFTHHSAPVRDAVSAATVPVIEVHISNIYAREEWRRKSVVSEVAKGVVAGLGVYGYVLAVEALGNLISEKGK